MVCSPGAVTCNPNDFLMPTVPGYFPGIQKVNPFCGGALRPDVCFFRLKLCFEKNTAQI